MWIRLGVWSLLRCREKGSKPRACGRTCTALQVPGQRGGFPCGPASLVPIALPGDQILPCRALARTFHHSWESLLGCVCLRASPGLAVTAAVSVSHSQVIKRVVMAPGDQFFSSKLLRDSWAQPSGPHPLFFRCMADSLALLLSFFFSFSMFFFFFKNSGLTYAPISTDLRDTAVWILNTNAFTQSPPRIQGCP